MCATNGFSQIPGKPFGTQTLSCGNIGILLKNNFSAIHNPSLLQQEQRPGISICQELPYLQKELTAAGVSVQTNLKNVPLEASFVQLGNPYFRQQQLSLASSKNLGEKLSIGVGLHYLVSSQYQQKKLSNVMGSVGMIFKLNSKWTIASHIANLTGARYKTDGREEIPRIIQIGASYKLLENLDGLIEIEKTANQKKVLKFGTRYRINSTFELLGGWNISPQLFSFGMMYSGSKYSLGLGFQQSQLLGLSPNFEFRWHLKKG
jgi:hypothetical protein